MNIKTTLDEFEQDIPAMGPFGAGDIARGICRYLRNLGYSPLTEFKLLSKRRVDVIGLNTVSYTHLTLPTTPYV